MIGIGTEVTLDGQRHLLTDLLRAGFFSPSDDAALHLATRLLLSDEDACRASIAEAVSTARSLLAGSSHLPQRRGHREPAAGLPWCS